MSFSFAHEVFNGVSFRFKNVAFLSALLTGSVGARKHVCSRGLPPVGRRSGRAARAVGIVREGAVSGVCRVVRGGLVCSQVREGYFRAPLWRDDLHSMQLTRGKHAIQRLLPNVQGCAAVATDGFATFFPGKEAWYRRSPPGPPPVLSPPRVSSPRAPHGPFGSRLRRSCQSVCVDVSASCAKTLLWGRGVGGLSPGVFCPLFQTRTDARAGPSRRRARRPHGAVCLSASLVRSGRGLLPWGPSCPTGPSPRQLFQTRGLPAASPHRLPGAGPRA